MKQLRELKKDTIRLFVGALSGRDESGDEGRYRQFLRWLEEHARIRGERVFGSTRTQLSVLGNKLMQMNAAESKFESFTEYCNTTFLDKDHTIIGELQRHGLLCSEIMFRFIVYLLHLSTFVQKQKKNIQSVLDCGRKSWKKLQKCCLRPLSRF
jgi:hypothetical protein